MGERSHFPHFGGNLRRARKAQRYTLAQLAREVGVSKTYLWELENDTEGKKSPSADVVHRLARLFGMSMEELLGVGSGAAAHAANRVELGVIEFHSERFNPGLIERFDAVRDDLTDAACIVDLWMKDIAAVLKEFGYEMHVYRGPEKQEQHEQWESAREAWQRTAPRIN